MNSIRTLIRLSLLGLVFLVMEMPLLAQSEAESAAEPGIFQSNQGKKDQLLPIGSKIRYQKSLKHRPSQPMEFGGIIDSSLVMGHDTIPLSEIGFIQAKNERVSKTGVALLIIGPSLLVLGALFTLLGIAAAFGFLLPLMIIFIILAYLCWLAFLPLTIAGLVMTISGKKWYNLRQEWKLVKASANANK